ncbi:MULTISPECIES: winged helix DNA-binding domain-containing protein [Streptomyces]|uniref:Winged helix DNA-binding domain-containing protein n=2 Tax=Streptomyces TaxID=1883 RepID=A0ABU4K2G5_9ACTN|nr:winged helix DNA-binding domain-containing protein [Streptomyces roseolus]MDX2291956.1 winged helix DNA-binding domain-containing protein [Streptomyces roseolus]
MTATAPPALTARALNRATLARQSLLAREPVGVEEAVRRAVALQAQQPGSPYVALWNRVADFDPAGLDAAVEGFRLVRSTLMRITLHLVHADDYRPFREAVEPTLRGSRLRDRRFTDTGITPEDADALLPELLAYADRPRTGDELRARAEESWGGGSLTPTAGRLLRQYAPLWHVPSGPPWQYPVSPGFVAARPEPVRTGPEAAAAGLETLARRYLAGFGPASAADLAQFGLVQRGRARAALDALVREGAAELLEGPAGAVLYDLPGAVRPDGDAPAPPRLMAMWDSTLLAYADRGRIVPAAYRGHVIRINGDVLPTLLVDGYVAGAWRPVDGGIEAAAFHPLTPADWDGLAAEAASLGRLLADRDPRVYGRYDHWWAKGLPAVETRVLPY